MNIKSLLSLSDENQKGIIIKFISEIDLKDHLYYSLVNSLTGDRLSGFDSGPPSINQSVSDIKSIIDKIRKQAVKIIYVKSSNYFWK